MSPEHDAKLLALALGFMDHPLWCRHCLKIRDKRGIPVPLELSPAQLALDRAIVEQEAAGKPVRLVVLKARQVHMSVGAASEGFHRIPFHPGRRGLVLAHLEKAAANIFEYYQQFLRSYRPFGPPELQIALPKLVKSNMDETVWANDARLTVGTAGSVEIGRSFSAQWLHLSEAAFYRDGGRLLTGLLQTVPRLPETYVIVESTANGMGGTFFDLWRMAKRGDADWRGVFFPWFDHPEYAITPERPELIQATLSATERELIRQHSLTIGQIAWRRWKIVNDLEGSEEKFCQEYPSNPEEAFLTSGRPRFDLISIARQPIIREPAVGDLETVRFGTETQIQFLPRHDKQGLLKVWQQPVPGHAYIIGADPAQGIDTSQEKRGVSDPDYSDAFVMDADSGEQVAQLHGRLTPATFGAYLCTLGRWYNWAFLVPEANPIGVAVVEEILRQQYPLVRVYQRRRDPTDRRPARLEDLGWLTTETSKPMLISALDRALRQLAITIHDEETAAQLRTYVIDARGRTNAEVGCHDDAVIAVALAIQGLEQFARVRQLPLMQVIHTAAVAYGAPRRRSTEED